MILSDNNIYALNGAAVGDLIAAAPSIKYAIDHYHERSNYRVALLPDFRDIFHFVPTSKIIPTAEKYDGKYAVRKLNMDGPGGNITRLTPSRLKLTEYASIGLLGRILPPEDLKYIPLQPVDVSHFGIDFSKCAIFITTYRDITRAWSGADIIETAKYVHSQGITPVFVGKKGAISIWKTLAVTDFEYPGFGHDLIDKTTFRELFTIMSQSKVVFGMDSGPLHLAFATDTPVVAGFTNIRPELRIPFRNPGVQTEAAVTPVSCQFCQSDWNLDFHNFQDCPKAMKKPKCTTSMKAEIFIEAFNKLSL
jgi:hypothetical protein